MIEQRLEHGEIANVLIPEGCLQLLHFVRHITQATMHVDNLMSDLPVNRVDLRFRFKIEQTEIERLLRFFFDLLDVVQTLKTISAFQPLFHVKNVRYQFVVLFARFDLELWCCLFDRTKRFDHEHRMMRDSGAPALAHNRRMRDAFGVTNVYDVPDDVVRVFLERIIGRTVKIAARSIIIDTEPAADIEITKFVSKFRQLGIVSRAFAHCALNCPNVRHLRSDVEMNKLRAMRLPGVPANLT